MRDSRFWRILLLVGLIHALLLSILLWFNRAKISPLSTTTAAEAGKTVWLDPSTLNLKTSNSSTTSMEETNVSHPAPGPSATPEILPRPKPQLPLSVPVIPSPRSENSFLPPIATPQPSPSLPKITPQPAPSSTPKPAPKVTPKPTPKAATLPPRLQPKKTATPQKPSPSKTVTSKPKKEEGSKKENTSPKKTTGKDAPASEAPHKKEESKEKTKKVTTMAASTAASATASASSASENSSQYGWYNDLIHDRFYGQWDQPTSLFDPQHKFSCALEIQISKDGNIMNYQVVRGSGNEVLDRSVLDAAARIKQINALPAGLGKNGIYTVRIEFELGN